MAQIPKNQTGTLQSVDQTDIPPEDTHGLDDIAEDTGLDRARSDTLTNELIPDQKSLTAAPQSHQIDSKLAKELSSLHRGGLDELSPHDGASPLDLAVVGGLLARALELVGLIPDDPDLETLDTARVLRAMAGELSEGCKMLRESSELEGNRDLWQRASDLSVSLEMAVWDCLNLLAIRVLEDGGSTLGRALVLTRIASARNVLRRNSADQMEWERQTAGDYSMEDLRRIAKQSSPRQVYREQKQLTRSQRAIADSARKRKEERKIRQPYLNWVGGKKGPRKK